LKNHCQHSRTLEIDEFFSCFLTALQNSIKTKFNLSKIHRKCVSAIDEISFQLKNDNFLIFRY
jgi:hypothetical protein